MHHVCGIRQRLLLAAVTYQTMPYYDIDMVKAAFLPTFVHPSMGPHKILMPLPNMALGLLNVPSINVSPHKNANDTNDPQSDTGSH